MSSGYKGYGNYRKYNPGGYKVNSYDRAYNRKRRNFKRIRNRIIIVTCGVLIAALIVFLFSLFMKNCICSSCSQTDQKTTETATINPNATSATVAQDSTVQEATEAPSEQSFITANVKDDNTNGKMVGGFYVWHNQAFDSFLGTSANAEEYANTVNKVTNDLGDGYKVYSMLVPSSIELNLPTRLQNIDGTLTNNSQADYIKTAYSKLNANVTPIYAYNTLAEHWDEDIYLKTDYRWSGLGAYYGYSAFANATAQQVLSLDSCKQKSVSGFNGSYSTAELPDESLKYWDFNYNTTLDIYSGDEVITANSCYFEGAKDQDASGKHIVFMQGDYSSVIHSSSKDASDEKIAIVHSSFGRFAVPYFSYNYKEVHSINTKNFDKDIAQYCKDKGITTVLFIDSVEETL